MELIRKKKLLALFILSGFGILISSYYMRTSLIEIQHHRKQAKHIRYTSPMTNRTIQSVTFKDVLDVQSFVFFIGYPRSSHSILASLIDGHPNAIIAHEFNLFPQLVNHENYFLTNRTLLYKALYKNSHYHSTHGWRSQERLFQSKGYSLQLNGSWQGTFRRLRVIGDKSGGITARMYRDNRNALTQVYQELTRLVRVPIKVIHVIRNPYDMIATRLLYRFSKVKGQKANCSSQHPLAVNTSQAIKGVYGEAKSVLDMSQALNLSVLEVHNADLVRNPKGEMRRVCKFLKLQCSNGYLDLIARNMFRRISLTRQLIVWSHEARDFIDTHILSLPFFKRYSFDSPF